MSKRRLNIAIFHLGFFFSGGGEKLVLEEAQGLRRRGHRVDIYAPVVDSKRCFPDLLAETEVKKLFPSFTFYYPLRDFIAITGSILLTPLLCWKFRKYDVFFGANQPGPLICWLLGRILKKPYVIYLAQPTRVLYPRKIDRELGFGKGSFDLFYLLAKFFYPVIKKLDEQSIKNANFILANGEFIAEVLEKTYGVKVICCPAGCYPARSSLAVSRFRGEIVSRRRIKKPYILLTNRHFPQKRFDYIISALPFILKEIPEVCLVITGGQTAYTSYLKALVGQLGIAKKVFFLGIVSEEKLTELYKNAAVYVYTAPQEDFGMGVIEAMAVGLPVVAWNSGGPATTVLHGKTGFLAQPFDVTDFSSRVTQLLLDKSLNRALGRNALRRASDFSYEKHVKSLEQVLFSAFRGVYNE